MTAAKTQERTNLIPGYPAEPAPEAPREVRDHSDCHAVSEMLARVGDKWTVQVVATLGEGPKRFNELRRAVGGISQRMLTLTLRALERDGLLTRTVYPTIPPRVDYELTKLGKSLLEPVKGLSRWVLANRAALEEARRRFDAAEASR